MCHRRLPVIVGLVLGLLFAGERGAMAEDLLARGIREFSSGQLTESLATLEQAARQTTDYRRLGQIQLYIGLNHALLGDRERAEQALSRALAHDPDLHLDPARFKKELIDLLSRVRGFVSELTVVADRDGAEVLIDGKRAGRSPLRTALPAGTYQITVRHGGATYVKLVTLAAGQNHKVAAVLTTAQQTPAPKSGPKSDAAPPSFWRRPRPWTWVAAGAAVAAAAAGTGLWISARSRHADWKDDLTSCLARPAADQSDCRSSLESDGESITSRALAGNVMLGVAGGLAAAAVVLLLLEGRPTEKETETQPATAGLRVVPQLGRTSGVLLQTRF